MGFLNGFSILFWRFSEEKCVKKRQDRVKWIYQQNYFRSQKQQSMMCHTPQLQNDNVVNCQSLKFQYMTEEKKTLDYEPHLSPFCSK